MSRVFRGRDARSNLIVARSGCSGSVAYLTSTKRSWRRAAWNCWLCPFHWVISRRVPEALRARIRVALLRMHLDRQGRRILQRAAFARFIEGRDRDYDPIRRMAKCADRVYLA